MNNEPVGLFLIPSVSTPLSDFWVNWVDSMQYATATLQAVQFSAISITNMMVMLTSEVDRLSQILFKFYFAVEC
jgi:hypothetical protein